MLMAGEKYIALEETSQEIKTAVEGVKTDVAGVNTDVDGVKNDTENIISQLTGSGGVIKNIQTGTITGGKPSVELVGFSNIDKMYALVMGSVKESNRWTVTAYYVKSLSVGSVSFTSQNSNMNVADAKGSYVVVEFY